MSDSMKTKSMLLCVALIISICITIATAGAESHGSSEVRVRAPSTASQGSSEVRVTAPPSASSYESDNPDHEYSGTIKNAPAGTDRAPKLSSSQTQGEVGITSNVDWNNIPGLVLHLFHNAVQGDPELEPIKTNLHFFGAFDLGASSGEGYCWWQIYDNPNADAAGFNRKLPSGLVLGLKHYPIQENDDWVTVFGIDPFLAAKGVSSPPDDLEYLSATDLRPDWDLSIDVNTAFFCWFETYNPDFRNWDEAEKKLPKGTVLGLKHSVNQPDKMVFWRGIQYDPVKSYRDRIASPPTFVARTGGDLGAPNGEGFYWFEKTIGPDFFQSMS